MGGKFYLFVSGTIIELACMKIQSITPILISR